MITLYDIVGTIKSKRERLRGVFWALGVGCLARFLFVVIMTKKGKLERFFDFRGAHRGHAGAFIGVCFRRVCVRGLWSVFWGFCAGYIFKVFSNMHKIRAI